MRERFGANDASCRLRFHTQTGGVTLRRSSRSTTSCASRCRRWPPCSAERSRCTRTATTKRSRSRRQRRRRSRCARSRSSPTRAASALTVDPLAGSYYVEHLTTELETARARAARARRRTRRRGAGDRSGILPGGDRAQRVRVPAARRARRRGHRRREQVRGREAAAGRFRRPTSPRWSAIRWHAFAPVRAGARRRVVATRGTGKVARDRAVGTLAPAGARHA